MEPGVQIRDFSQQNCALQGSRFMMDITLGRLLHRKNFQDILLCAVMCNLLLMSLKKIFNKDVHIFNIFGFVMWLFVSLCRDQAISMVEQNEPVLFRFPINAGKVEQ